jgi:putative addiction module component (TIGR02574 family)
MVPIPRSAFVLQQEIPLIDILALHCFPGRLYHLVVISETASGKHPALKHLNDSEDWPMAADIRRLLDEALQLDSSARAQFAETLLESLEPDEDVGFSNAWRDEIRRRCAEIDSGAVTLIDGDEVLAELRDKYRR